MSEPRQLLILVGSPRRAGNSTTLAKAVAARLVGVVRVIGNRHGEVGRDPSDPVFAAEHLGREIFSRMYSDGRIDTRLDEYGHRKAPKPSRNKS